VSVLLAVSVSRAGAGQVAERLGVGLAVVGSGWWIVRDLGILLGDHSVGFKIVHTLLAAVTVILSLWVVWSVRRSTRRGYLAPGGSR
jgi:heme A synthase